MRLASSIEDEYIDRRGEQPVFFPMGRSRLGGQKVYVLGPDVDTDKLLAAVRALGRMARIYVLLVPVIFLGTLFVLTAAFGDLWVVTVNGSLLVTSAPIFLIRWRYSLKIQELLRGTYTCQRSVGLSDFVVPSWSTWFMAALTVLGMMILIAAPVTMLSGTGS